MQVFRTMAAGGNQKETLTKNLYGVPNGEDSKQDLDDCALKKEQLSFTFMKDQDEFLNSGEQNNDDFICCSMSDRMSNDISCSTSERNIDDINQSSDSLSSSASISDSDLTSTDSEDSLALSESESITDVTPLNSPYCDSPLPQNRHIEYKSEDKIPSNISSENNCAVPNDSPKPEMNVLLKAIEKLELEAKRNSEFGFRESLMQKRAATFSSEETKKIDQENQRLLKRVISQQNRARSVYSSNQPSSKSLTCRHQALVKSDGDISGTPKKSLIVKVPKDGDKFHVRRRQKCLSHPSSFIYSCNHHTDKSVLMDGVSTESCGKKKCTPRVKKMSSPQNIKSNYEEGGSTQLN